MSDLGLRVYHALPAALRSVVASARGYYLRSWRYGRETDGLVREAAAREAWTPAQWQSWHDEQLVKVLRRAATRVPFYREHWENRRRQGDTATWDDLRNWPVLTKETLRERNRDFLADDCDPRSMYRECTSGTTGKAILLWNSRATLTNHYALHEARNRNWHGVSRHDRWAMLGGQLVVPVTTRRPPFWVWNAALNQLYMSSYHLAPDLVPAYLDALERYRIVYLLGYTSSLYALARAALEHQRRSFRLKVVIANAEPVFEHQRQAIEEAFQCRLCETYGMSEYVAAATECAEGRLHLWPELGHLEVCEGDHSVPDGTPGDLVCTSLLNGDMPLIRYRLGDRGSLPTTQEPCPCGRTLPVLASIEGRSDDVLYTRDGRRIGRLDPVFKGGLPVREAQIVQETLDQVMVRVVPAATYTAEDGHRIVQRIQQRMGPIRVDVELVDSIPRTGAGKFRAVICNLPRQLRDEAGIMVTT